MTLQSHTRFNKRIQQRADKQMRETFVECCRQFTEGFKTMYTVAGEDLWIDEDAVAELITKLDNRWRIVINHNKPIIKDFHKALYGFTETCNTTIESAKDRVYVPVVCSLLETKYGIDRADWPTAEVICKYRKQGLSANDAAVRITLHEKSVVNNLKN